MRLRAVSKILEIEWDDGVVGALPYRILRQRCPCAECRQQRRAEGVPVVSDELQISAVVALGPAAVNVRFSDGHARGIFPFAYLRELQLEIAMPTPGISK